MTDPRARMAERLALWATLAGALAIRVWYVVHTTMPVVDSDAFGYDQSAMRLLVNGYYARASGAILGLRPNAFTVPGFPIFLSGVYRVFGMGADRYMAVYLVQTVLSAATVGLVYLVARRLSGNGWAGSAAAVIAAVYPPFIYGNGLILTEPLYTFALVALVWLVLWAADRGSWWAFLITGAWFGVATLIRPTAAPWVLLVVAYLFADRYGWKRVAVSSAALALGAVLVMTPWWVRNYMVLHRVVLLSTMTANPLFRSTYLYYGAPPHWHLEWPSRLGQDESALNDYQQRVADERIVASLRRNPLGTVTQRYNRTRAAVFSAWATPVGGRVGALTRLMQLVLVWLFLLSPFVLWRKPAFWLLWSVPVLFAIVHTLSLVFARYLFPVMPLVIVLAVATLWEAGTMAARLLPGRTESPADGRAL